MKIKGLLILRKLIIIFCKKTDFPTEPSKASKIYMEYCFSCHEFGVNGAPAPGDEEAWDTRLSQGKEVLLRNTIFGMPPVMPPRGLCEACTDSDLDVVLDFMIHGAGGA